MKRFFLLLLLSSVLMAYDSPLSQLIFILKIPVLSTSAASRIIILASFSLSVLAAFGFDDLMNDWKKGVKKRIVWFVLVLTSIIGFLWILLFVFHIVPPEAFSIAKRNMILPTIVAFGILFSMAIGFVKNTTIRNAAILVILLVSMVDSVRYVSKWMPFEPRKFVFPQTGMTDFLSKNTGTYRVFGNIGNEVGSTYKIPLIEGYDAMYQGRYAEFINAASSGKIVPGGRSVVEIDKNGDFTDTIFSLLGVKYIVYRLSDGRREWVYPHWKNPETFLQRYADDAYWVYENTLVYKRAFLASSYRLAHDGQSIITEMFSGKIDLSNTVVLELKPDVEPQVGSGSARIVSYSANQVMVETESEVPKLLFLSDVYDSGWRAYIDRNSTRIQRADYDFRVVAVPPGKHMIRFVYMPQEVLIGGIVSVFGLLGFLFLSKKNI
jgi:hypothetical protein